MRESTSTHWHFHFVVWQGEPCSAPLVGRWRDFTSSMLSVTAGTAIFLSTVICLGVAVGSIYWGWFYRERQKRGWGWGDAFLWSRMWQPGVLSVSKSREREVSLIAGKTCIPLEFNESGAGVRLCEWVSLGWRQREREKVLGLGCEGVGIRSRTPSSGRSGRTLGPATSRHQSADGDKPAENEAFSQTISKPTCSWGQQPVAVQTHSRLMTSLPDVAFKHPPTHTHTWCGI